MGVVLSKVDMKALDQYEGYRGEYYHNNDFANRVIGRDEDGLGG
jgi:hypothetical protein